MTSTSRHAKMGFVIAAFALAFMLAFGASTAYADESASASTGNAAPMQLKAAKASKKAKAMKVVFKPNAKKAKGKMKAMRVKVKPGEGKNLHISGKLFTRKGYTLTGWSSTKGVSGGSVGSSRHLYIDPYLVKKKLVLYAVWEKAPKLKLTHTVETETDQGINYNQNAPVPKTNKVEAGRGFYFRTSNEIAKITSSDSRIAKATIGSLGPTSGTVYGLDPGKAIITVTDVAGSTKKFKVKVSLPTEHGTMTSSTIDTNMKPPTLIFKHFAHQTFNGNSPLYDMSLAFQANFKNGDYSQGYQLRMADRKDITGGEYGIEIIDQRESDEMVAWIDELYVSRNANEYYQVRSYKKSGSKMICSPWSPVTATNPPNTDKQRSDKAQYDYELYFLDRDRKFFYGSEQRPVYIKTNNPNPESIVLTLNGDLFDNDERSTRYTAQRNLEGDVAYGYEYADVKYARNFDHGMFLRKVKGGYFTYLKPNDWTTGKKSGDYVLQVREANASGYAVAKQATVKVLYGTNNYETWLKGIYDRASKNAMTPDMNPKQKLEALVEWVNGHEGFKYLPNRSGTLVNIAKGSGMLFENCRMDSSVAPGVLTDLANMIGGFDEVENMYQGWPNPNDPKWVAYHACCRIVYQGEEHYYTVCPVTSSGEVGAIDYIDFADPTELHRFA